MADQTVYTDGSCEPNNSSPQSRGGYALVYASGKNAGRIIMGSLELKPYPPTNIRAEGMAICTALDTEIPTTIYTDSLFWVKMIKEYIPTWTAKKFQKCANPDIVQRLVKLMTLRTPVIEYTPAHTNGSDEHAYYNALADKYANVARCTHTRPYGSIWEGGAQRPLKPPVAPTPLPCGGCAPTPLPCNVSVPSGTISSQGQGV